MKMRPLPETDLANVTGLPKDRRRKRLQAIKFVRPPHSYDPSRFCAPDTLNRQYPLLGDIQPVSTWEQIETRICELSSDEDEANVNVGVSKPLYRYVTEQKLTGRALNMSRMSLGLGISVEYWASTGLVIDERLVVPFLDFRRTGLSPEGQRIVFSLMRQHIETRYPDYGEARLAIIQFTDARDRKPIFRFADGVSLLPYEQLQREIEETYQLWYEVLEERAEEIRRTGGKGTLL